jgi:hypothetical protein
MKEGRYRDKEGRKETEQIQEIKYKKLHALLNLEPYQWSATSFDCLHSH